MFILLHEAWLLITGITQHGHFVPFYFGLPVRCRLSKPGRSDKTKEKNRPNPSPYNHKWSYGWKSLAQCSCLLHAKKQRPQWSQTWQSDTLLREYHAQSPSFRHQDSCCWGLNLALCLYRWARWEDVRGRKEKGRGCEWEIKQKVEEG